MRGIYRVYEDGKLLTEGENLITTAGKTIITQYLAGKIPSYAGAIAIGSGTTAAAVGDTSLAMEYTRLPVYASYANIDVLSGTYTWAGNVVTVTSSVNHELTAGTYIDIDFTSGGGTPDGRYLVASTPSNTQFTFALSGSGTAGNLTFGPRCKIVHKAVFPENSAGYITEMGLWPAMGNSVGSMTDQRMLTSSVTTGSVWTSTVGTLASTAGIASAAGGPTTIRIGTNSITFDASEAGTVPCSIDLSQYSPSDLIKVAFYTDAGTANSFVVRLEVDSSNYYSKTISHGTASTYTIDSSALSTWTATGTPSLSNVKTIRITNGTGRVLYVDGIKIDPVSTYNPVYGLVSRSVLGSPIVKRAGSRYDLEYEITVAY